VGGEAGIDAAALADPDARIPFELTNRVWPAAQAQWGRPGLGLHTGHALAFGELGVLDYVTASAATVGLGLEELARAFRIVSFGATALTFTRRAGGAGEVHYGGPFPPEVRDYGIAGMVRRLRDLGAAASAVWLAGPPLDDARAYERVLEVTPRFHAPTSGFSLRAADLDRPRSDDRYRGLAPIVGRELERLLSEAPAPTASAEARRIVARLLPAGVPELAAVARGMSVSPRTLQRRLAAEGTSLRELVEATREQLAVSHLAQGRLRVGEIAYLLGYSEPGTFTTAFKRWRGLSPSEHRAAAASPREASEAR
jgi:AraC-like DNA-binding protein